MSPTERSQIITEALLNCVIRTLPDGTDLAEKLELKWLNPVLTSIIVGRTPPGGLAEVIQLWLMGMLNAKCVLVLLVNVVIIQISSPLKIAADFTCTNLSHHHSVICAIVEADCRTHKVHYTMYAFSLIFFRCSIPPIQPKLIIIIIIVIVIIISISSSEQQGRQTIYRLNMLSFVYWLHFTFNRMFQLQIPYGD